MGLTCSNYREAQRRKSISPKSLQPEWTLCAEVSKRQFIKKASKKWGFDQTINYVTDIAARFQPWVTNGRYLAPVLTNSDYFELGAIVPLLVQTHGKFLLVIEKRHNEMLLWKTVKFPQHMSFDGLDETKTGLSRPFHIIGVRDELFVIQVCRSKQLGVFEGYLAREDQGMVVVLRAISFACGCHAEDGAVVMEAFISPDHTKILLKPSWAYFQQLETTRRQCLPEDCVYLLDLSNGELTSTKLFLTDGMNKVLAFDPRFAWSRLAIGSRCDGVCGLEEEDSATMFLSVMDIRQQEYLASISEVKSASQQHHRNAHGTQNLVFSPDGRILAALTGSVSTTDAFHIVPYSVRLYRTDNLNLLSEFTNPGHGRSVHVTPTAIFPLFSMDCQRVAFLSKGMRKSRVMVVSLPIYLTLRHLCRAWFRRNLSTESLLKLPLSRQDKDYVLYRHSFE